MFDSFGFYLDASSPKEDRFGERLAYLTARHGFVVLRDGVERTDADLVALIESLGTPTFTEGEAAVEGFPTLNVVSNIGRSPKSTWHTDTSYVERPPAITVLKIIEVPERGGDTMFCCQRRALHRLPREEQERLARLYAEHVVTGLPTGELSETRRVHPLVRRHPLTNDLSLYISTPARCTVPEEPELIPSLYEAVTAPDNVRRHTWRAGDVLLWDNRTTLHRADHSDVVGHRVLHRGLVAGEVPLGASHPAP